MKPYEHYKETGLNWFPKIPAHWGMVRNGVLFSEVVDTGYNDLELLSITTDKGIIKQTDTGRKKRASDDMAKYKRIRPGDIGYNLMNAFMGAIGMSDYEGIISPAYAVCRPKVNLNSRYYHYLFRTPLYKQEFDKNSYGIMYERNRLYFDHFASISVPAPDIKEQNTIVAYIQTAEEKIDKYIETKQKEISVLEEYKQTIINEAVTKGLDRAAQMKDSGIEWIGQIPAHWEVKRFRHIFDTFKGLNITKADLQETGIPVISYGQIHSKANQGTGIHEDLLRFVDESYLESDKKSLTQEHDFLFADTSEDVAGIGNCVYVNTSRPLFAGYHTIIARPHGIEFPRYLAFLFLSDAWRAQLRRIVNGVKVYSVNQKLLNQTNLLLPPVQEQKEIVAYLDGVCEKLTQTIQNINRQIELLNEYRTTLISDVVTGQVNVCENP